jgi:hypothetical protein
MLSDVDHMLQRLLSERAGLPAEQIDFSFALPHSEWSQRISKPTVNIYMFAINENADLRDARWSSEGPGDRVVLRRPPLRLDLHYMLTSWTSEPQDEHDLLWAMFISLARCAEVPVDLAPPTFRGGRPIRLEVAHHEARSGRWHEYWTAIGNRVRPAVELKVTVACDLDQQEEAVRVRQRLFGVRRMGSTDPAESSTSIGGFVSSGGRPQPGAEVTVFVRDGETWAPRTVSVSGPDGSWRAHRLSAEEIRIEAICGDLRSEIRSIDLRLDAQSSMLSALELVLRAPAQS